MRLLLALVVITSCCAAAAGSLTPPGPPAPTMKPLSDIEPRSAIRTADLPLAITSPGSYYLAESVRLTASSSATTAAIIIESDNVTIDLNGFTLGGTLVPEVSGIVSRGPYNNIVVKNGIVTDFEEDGIELAVNSAIVENVMMTNIHGTAISMANGKLVNCTVTNCLSGLFFSTPSAPLQFGQAIIDGCQVLANGETGIRVNRPAIIRNTISSFNSYGAGINCRGKGTVITNCVASNNSYSGIIIAAAAENSRLSGNTCESNGESGISVSAKGCRIEENHVASNDLHGLLVTQRSMVFKNTAYDNGDSNYSFATETVHGPIATTTLSYGAVTSDQPWANWSFHSDRVGN